MEYEKRYKDPGEDWFQEVLADIIERTEGSGYWKQGTVKEMLDNDQIVFTPTAEYRKLK